MQTFLPFVCGEVSSDASATTQWLCAASGETEDSTTRYWSSSSTLRTPGLWRFRGGWGTKRFTNHTGATS